MSGFVSAIKSGVDLMKRGDDDSYDRVSSRFSVGICIVFAFLISGGQYIGEPISCFSPGEFNPQWGKYVDQYCWVKNTYYVPYSDDIPSHEAREQLEITYYQWTPIVLAVQAFMFTIPGLFWKVFSSGAGYDLHHIVNLCLKTDNLNPTKRDELIAYLTNHMDRLLGYRREYRQNRLARIRKAAANSCCMVGKRYGNYLFILYLFVKLLYVGNAIGQLYALNFFIGDGYHMYGVTVLADLINHKGWEASPFFPRVTLCEVKCVLPWNLFNEKIFIFLWWWLIFVVIISVVGLIVWLLTLTPNSNVRFIGKYLKVMGRLSGTSDKERKLVREFTYGYLRQDGVFVARMLALQVNDLTTAEVICSLWDNFISYRAKSVEDLPPPVNL